MKKITTLLFLLLSCYQYAQVKGTVTDTSGKPIAFVNIYVKDTYISTTSNEQGKYELNIKKTGDFTILFQYIGYKTEKRTIAIDKFPFIVDVTLGEEDLQLNEVVISQKNNPANEIIKKAIANRKENSKKTAQYNADFYSRGIFRVKDLPKKIMGQKIDMFDDMLDSTRSGILYLSETVSRITFQKPDKLKEVIIASKVSGNDNGFSFNSAASANFDFYENNLEFKVKVISPIADNAFNYYKYKFDGSFYDENNQQINKIKVIPRRENEPVMEGYIYIVDDSWAVYAVDLSVKGSQMQTPALNTLILKQNYSYNNINKIWIKNTQTLDFDASILGLKMNGRFTYVYSNFEFPEKLDKKTFTAEVLKFEKNANKKDDDFWNTIRPVPLTDEELNDYAKKNILQTKKKSQVYLDSIDKKHNKFKPLDVLMGYSYNNTFKKYSIQYDGPIMSTSFNTVQGYTLNAGLSYNKNDDEKRTFSSIGTRFYYGFTEKKIRAIASYSQKFNNFNYSTLSIVGGSYVNQFNNSKPISNLVNAVSSLFFRNNYMKLYEKNFVSANFSREIINGINMTLVTEYAERKPLWNSTDFSIIKSDDLYSSNNPVLPSDYINPAIEKHNLVKTNFISRIKFGQHYWTRPDGKFNIGNEKYPNVNIGYEKTIAATNKKLEYDLVTARFTHDLSIGNKGELKININGGKFFNANNISFVDYKHFNGNQTHLNNGDSYMTVFNLLPYYSSSTNDSYIETHIEHNDSGYFMNKIPLLNKLQTQLVLGFHNLAVPTRKPYQEFTIGLDNLGWGKVRFFRIDYIRSYQNGFLSDGVTIGFKLLNVVE